MTKLIHDSSQADRLPEVRINNRRYLGNKYRLLGFIRGVVREHCAGVETFADLFSGTGAVASAFREDCTLITNDILYSNYLANVAWFGAEDYNEDLVRRMIIHFNRAVVTGDNYMSENFADTYFSLEECRRIGFIRQQIHDYYTSGTINFREMALLTTSLLYAMDKIARTCGHYDAYRKGAPFDGHIELRMPAGARDNKPGNRCFNTDINRLAPQIRADLVYLDPPYNSRQYCDTYHLPENVARWEKPALFGQARKMDRSALKSRYCTREALDAFADLIRNIQARYILLSYNDMADHGDVRSNARMTDNAILEIMARKGQVEIFSEQHRAFSAGRSPRRDNCERLFLCTCRI